MAECQHFPWPPSQIYVPQCVSRCKVERKTERESKGGAVNSAGSVVLVLSQNYDIWVDIGAGESALLVRKRAHNFLLIPRSESSQSLTSYCPHVRNILSPWLPHGPAFGIFLVTTTGFVDFAGEG